jgi:hypothetical protein
MADGEGTGGELSLDSKSVSVSCGYAILLSFRSRIFAKEILNALVFLHPIL